MKKIFCLSILGLVLILWFQASGAAQDTDPMATFMEAQWGINATVFSEQFKYKDLLKKDDDFFYLTDFDLGGQVLKKIKFKFDTKSGEQAKLRKPDYDRIFFTEAYMFFKPEQYETLLEVFKVKYGAPTKYDEFEVRDGTGASFLQKVALWENQKIKRMIVMERQASKLVDSMISFIPIKEKVPVKEEDKIKEAADKI